MSTRYEADNGEVATDEEAAVIAALQRLGKRWPRSLTIASMGGTLVVVHTTSETWNEHQHDGSGRQDAVLADVPGPPNTGGDW